MRSPVLSYQATGAVRARPLLTTMERLVFIIFGLLLPAVCYFVFAVVIPALTTAAGFIFFIVIAPVAALGGTRLDPWIDQRLYPFEPRWQAGGWDRYITFIPDGRAGFAFFPLVFFSTIALCLFILRPQTSRAFSVRLGLVTGAILYAQYSIIQAAAINDPQPVVSWAFIVTAMVGLGSCLLFLLLLRLIKVCERLAMKSAFGVLALVLSVVLVFWTVYWNLVLLPLPGYAGGHFALKAIYSVVLFAPAWAAGVFARAAIVASRISDQADVQRQPTMVRIVSSVCWLASYLTAWKMAIANAAVLYAALPLTGS